MFHAVIVGINSYRDPDIRDLDYACADACRFTELLKQRLADKVKIWPLLNENATRENIMSTIGEDLPGQVKIDDTVLLYFASHGCAERQPIGEKRARYLVPHDATYSRIYSTAIDMDRDLASWMERLSGVNAKLVMVFLDTCFSGAGAAAEGDASKSRTFLGPALRAKPIKEDGHLEFDAPVPLQELDLGRGQVIMSAADRNQVARENSALKHGVFTHELLKSLSKPREGAKSVPLAVVYSEVYDGVVAETKGQQEPIINMRMKNARFPCLCA